MRIPFHKAILKNVEHLGINAVLNILASYFVHHLYNTGNKIAMGQIHVGSENVFYIETTCLIAILNYFICNHKWLWKKWLHKCYVTHKPQKNKRMKFEVSEKMWDALVATTKIIVWIYHKPHVYNMKSVLVYSKWDVLYISGQSLLVLMCHLFALKANRDVHALVQHSHGNSHLSLEENFSSTEPLWVT